MYYSQNQIKDYQTRKARDIAQYAYLNSKFYNHLYKGLDLKDVWNLPTINKAKMMEDFGSFNTLGFTTQELVDFCLQIEKERDFVSRYKGINVGMSSGTSGNKGIIVTTPREENYLRAAFFSRFTFLPDERLNVAFILRVSSPAFNLQKFGHKLTYVSQLDSIENINRKLNQINPNIISAPPSMFEILADEQKNRRLRVKPKRLISYAEVLSDEVKRKLETVFNCPVHQIYQCSEGSIAIACKKGSLHINEDLVAVQLYTEDGSTPKPGEPCQKMVITDLHKTSQPIIRYELNDLITISPKRCACGSNFRVIESIQGRCDDLFWSKRTLDGKWQFILPDYIRRSIISASEKIEKYQIIQLSPVDVEARIIIKSGDEEREEMLVKAAIKDVFVKLGCAEPNIVVKFCEPEINQYSQKMIRVIREFEIQKYMGVSY